ncbi:MFS transporter [Streptomyces sp. NPDC050211]|uniref:MFS transporter n=1 Tax=Streptomyces sp. NPDC050211 TaxID=3154932 RepID=UPI003443B568
MSMVDAPRSLLTAVALHQFVIAGAGAVVAMLGRELGAANGLSATWLPWAVIAYVVGLGALVLPARRLGRRTGPLVMLLIGLWMFAQASVACTLVPDAGAFLALRAAQGAGAAALTAAALLVVPVHTNRLLVVWGTVLLAGVTAGLVAGAYVPASHWRWTFWADVPLAAAGGVTAIRVLRVRRRRGRAPAAVRDAVAQPVRDAAA